MSLEIWYLIWFVLAVLVSFTLNFLGKFLAYRFKILDNPNIDPAKKKHKQPIPLTGGLAITFSSLFLVGILWLLNKYNIFDLRSLIDYNLKPFQIIWVFIGTLIIAFLGFLDDKFDISIKSRFIFLQIAILIIVIFGKIQIDTLSYPFESLVTGGSIFSILLSYLWILVCLSATKFLDGLDGIAGTVSLFGFLTIAAISNQMHVAQPLLVILALIWAGSTIGFLFFNLPPAKIYLGETGSTVLGLWIGVLSILSGAKVATTSTVIGWFILDITLVIIARVLEKRPPLGGDRTHWQHRLGYFFPSKIKILAFTSLLLVISSHLGLILQTKDKAIMIGLQVILFILAFYYSYKKMRTAETKNAQLS